MERLTDAEIAELWRLEREATPGPWYSDGNSVGGWAEPENDYQREITKREGKPGWPITVIGSGYSQSDDAIGDGDAALLIAIRNALPQLLAEIVELREQVKQLEEAVGWEAKDAADRI